MSDQVGNGMHGSNHRHWHIERQIQASKQTGIYTILHHLMFERDDVAQQWGDQENEFWYVKLRDGWPPQGIAPAPRRRIHVRMFHPNWCELNATAWADHTVKMLSKVRSGGREYDLFADPFVCISPANEQNLHYECGDTNPANQPRYRTVDHYKRIAEFAATWAERVDILRPDRKALLCWPALAQGHDPEGSDIPDGEYQIREIRDAMALYEIGASHPYGHDDWENGETTLPDGRDAFWHMLRCFRPEGYRDQLEPGRPHDPGGCMAQFPGKPWLFTEAGTFRHSDRTRTPVTLRAMKRLLELGSQHRQWLGVTWFIGNTDAAHAGNNIGANPELLQALADLQPYPTVATWPTARERTTKMDPLATALHQEFEADFIDLRGELPMANRGFARSLDQIQDIALHHTAGERSWQGIAQQHVDQWGTSIAYPLGVWGDRVFLLHDIDRLTPCVGAENRRALCVAVMGDFTQRQPTDVEVDRVRRLVRVLRSHVGRELPVRPHSSYKATECPGSWREYLGVIAGGDGPVDAVAAAALAWFERNQVIHPAPGHALPDAIAAEGWHMYTPEGRIEIDGTEYAVLGGGDPSDTDDEGVAIARVGDWGNVRIVRRARG